MDLCPFCLSELFPRNMSMGGRARVNATGVDAPGLNTANVGKLAAEGGVTFIDATGRVLPMTAVATVHGSRVCALHAIEETGSRR